MKIKNQNQKPKQIEKKIEKKNENINKNQNQKKIENQNQKKIENQNQIEKKIEKKNENINKNQNQKKIENINKNQNQKKIENQNQNINKNQNQNQKQIEKKIEKKNQNINKNQNQKKIENQNQNINKNQNQIQNQKQNEKKIENKNEKENENENEKEKQKQEKRENTRRKVVQEIYESEKVYVASIHTLIETFLQPLRKLPKLITVDQIKMLFSQIEVIYSYNNLLLTQVEERWKNWDSNQKIGDVFLQIAAFLKTYTEYVRNYNSSINTLILLQKKKDFNRFLKKQESKDGKINTISAFLILPVQRIPRYVLLVKELIKNTSKEHPDYQNLIQAQDKIEEVASYLNEKKREAENINQVLEIQKRVHGLEVILSPSRKFIEEKKMQLVVKNHLVDVVMFIFNDLILIAKQKGSKFELVDSLVLNGEFHFQAKDKTLAVINDVDPKLIIKLTHESNQKPYFFKAKDNEEVGHIVSVLDSLIETFFDQFLSLTPYITQDATKFGTIRLKKVDHSEILKQTFIDNLESSKELRILKLTPKQIYLFDHENINRPSMIYELTECRVRIDVESNGFELKTPTKVHLFSTGSLIDSIKWVNKIRECWMKLFSTFDKSRQKNSSKKYKLKRGTKCADFSYGNTSIFKNNSFIKS
ncbi:faciogenital dysplasia protein [Anaeramoeba ignava]|uniref:Faciogenital dysplasia protein n=1 Tax=Anaeramoeba ignava TaxID=1746090 RepID=A0A9Q0RE83_ANAIG|nr:faciogenital dysplasia protein [Anaeramoeba ignava]